MWDGCENDIQTIQALTFIDSIPPESATDIEVVYSEGGRVQAKLTGPLMVHYGGDDPHTEFPSGFEVCFYDSIMQVTSVITARFGLLRDGNETMEARNNVVVTNNRNGEQLFTEHLVWDQKKNQIFSDVFVKIISGEDVIYGDGLVSDQDFESYTVRNPSGEFTVEDGT